MVDARHNDCYTLFIFHRYKQMNNTLPSFSLLILLISNRLQFCFSRNFFIWVFSVMMQVFLNHDKFGRSKKHEQYRISCLNFALLCLCHLYFSISSFGHIAKRVVHLDGNVQTWLHWHPSPFWTQLCICPDEYLLYFSYSNLILVYISICMTNPCCR